jgi:hypothetical protein
MLISILCTHKYELSEFNAMSYRYTLEEILQFSNDKFMNFSITSLVWNNTNEVSFMIKNVLCPFSHQNLNTLMYVSNTVFPI